MRKLTLLAAGAPLLVAAYLVVVWLASGGANDGCSDRNRQVDLGPPPARTHGPAPGGGATALGIGGNKSCAVMKDGGVWCWGDDVEYPALSSPSLLTDLLNRDP